ncbi:unnamed protein product [Durusdinium trenchii]|uniref:SRPBCC family protein n=1 Tax=Durusdinium trenchii TaxID=1381693 RepID=A0ABP0IU97_9DINO
MYRWSLHLPGRAEKKAARHGRGQRDRQGGAVCPFGGRELLRDVPRGGGLGAPRIVEEGEPSGRHCARRVGLCIVERIQEAERGKFIEYTIDKGPWPTSYNRARVSFEALDGGTLVTWRSNFTPFFGCWWLSSVVGLAFRTMLGTLAAAAVSSAR